MLTLGLVVPERIAAVLKRLYIGGEATWCELLAFIAADKDMFNCHALILTYQPVSERVIMQRAASRKELQLGPFRPRTFLDLF